MKVIAIDRFEYANKLRLPGEEFETDSDEHAKLLQLAQRVKIVNTRDLHADDEDKPRQHRRYNTRRMKAEE